jgi:aldehyde dehydrogenase
MSFAKPQFKTRYQNFIGGKWVDPIDGRYFLNSSPVDGQACCEIPRSNKADVDRAVDVAWQAAKTWTRSGAAERSALLNKAADCLEAHLERLAVAESWDNGKPVRETLNADIPLAIDHFRYFAGVIRGEAGDVCELDADTVSMEVHEPLGVVGQIIPWNFPILMAAWKLAPALAAGNCVVIKAASQTPVGILMMMEVIGDVLPPGTVNVVSGFGSEVGQPLATHPGVMKVGFTGETTTGRLIMQYASENIIPVTLELGGKSPNIFCESVMAEDDEFLDKAIEGLVLFAFNQGEVCTCPSRALVHERIYDRFIERCIRRVEAIKMGDPLDAATMMGAQASKDQYDKILGYIEIGKQEGAEVLTGGGPFHSPIYPDGFYIRPTLLKGHNKMRVFQEEIFGPVLAVTTFQDDAEALEIANDTIYGLGSGVWTRDVHQMRYFQRGIEAGRVWCNCYHLYPAHASFGGYKKSGIGRETHKMMLNHYRHTKNILVSYSKKPLGFF